MNILSMENITVQYEGTKKPCLKDLNFSVEKGEIVVILGPSGCGKSTLLKTVSGLVQQKNGDVYIDNELMNGKVTEKRPIAMVFQNAYLFKGMTVEDNINFAPRVNGTMSKAEMKEETERIVRLVKLEGLEKRKATQLSGGQEQRVSLGRALMVKPKLMLLDEPFSALDAQLRNEMRENVRSIFKEIGQSAILVTHDQQEAATVGDRIAVMSNGRILQYDTPKELFSHPVSLEVAKFLGWENILPAKQNGSSVSSSIGDFVLNNLKTSDRDVFLLIPSEDAVISSSGKYDGIVTGVRHLGVRSEYRIKCNDTELTVSSATDDIYSCGDLVKFDVNTAHMWTVPPEIMNEDKDETSEERRSFRSLFRRRT